MIESSSTPEGARKSEQLRAWLWAGCVSLATSLAILAPFLWLGTASGHDIQFHISSWLDAAGQWKEGILFPRWTEWANYGFGEPRFIFYPPFSWVLGAGLGSVLPWTWIPPVFVLVVQTFAGISAFALIRRYVSLTSAAVLGAVTYAANPYALLVIYLRSDYAELLATSFYPLLLLFALRLCGFAESKLSRRKNILWFSVLFAAVWLSNAPAGVLASYSLALLFFWATILQKTWRPMLRGFGGIALGLGLASFYLVPAAYEQRWVNISGALAEGLTPADNFLFAVTPDAEHDAFNRIASFTAVLLMVCTLAAAVVLWRKVSSGLENRERGRTLAATFVLALAASVMMTRATTIFWIHLPKLRFVQFPWRWMAVLAVVFALFFAAAATQRTVIAFWIAMAIMLGGTGTYLVRHTWWDAEDVNSMKAAMDGGAGFEGTDEYDPLGDDHTDIPQGQPEAKPIAGEAEAKLEPRQPEIRILRWSAEDRVVLVKTVQPVKIRLRLLHHPAWSVRVNGRSVPLERTVSYDAIVVPVPMGESRIEAQFTRTKDRTTGGTISVLSALAAVLMGWTPKRKQITV
jgi:hypothetical protein